MNEHLVIPRGHRVHWFRVICEIVAADLTLQAIADRYGVTREAIRISEKRLVEKIKDYMKEALRDIRDVRVSLGD